MSLSTPKSRAALSLKQAVEQAEKLQRTLTRATTRAEDAEGFDSFDAKQIVAVRHELAAVQGRLDALLRFAELRAGQEG
jgi:hypothetical protein